jgi:hypothetical protein
MNSALLKKIENAKQAAIQVLLHNSRGPYNGLPRAAGWGYPEPYTRDLMISALGVLVSKNAKLKTVLRKVLQTCAKNQTSLGHIPSLVDDPNDRGASDTTPLFLFAVGLFRTYTSAPRFLEKAVHKAMTWMQYQSPTDRVIVAQQPTSDWRDEQWVTGYGLYVNSIVYTSLRLFGENSRAKTLCDLMNRPVITSGAQPRHVYEGFSIKEKPYYAFWSYKVHNSDRFDLVGNSLAIISGIASPSKAQAIISWVEHQCRAMQKKGELAVYLPPNFFPYIQPKHPDWRPRYNIYNKPGEYHNGGIWPFACALYIAALIAAKRFPLAEKKLENLTNLITPSREAQVEFGFNEWHKAQNGKPMGQDWQTWSAALYLYAAECVLLRKTPFFDEIRSVI